MRRFLLILPAAGVLLLAGCSSSNNNKNVNVGFNSNDAKNAANSAVNAAQNAGGSLQNAASSAVHQLNATPVPTP
jgi:uncharacterized lipoprotein